MLGQSLRVVWKVQEIVGAVSTSQTQPKIWVDIKWVFKFYELRRGLMRYIRGELNGRRLCLTPK